MNFFVFPNFQKKHAFECSAEVCEFLNKNNANVYIEQIYEDKFKDLSYVNFGEIDEIVPNVDVIIVIGGDGTMLKASKFSSKYKKPILGINCGRLGFITTIEKDEIYLLYNIFNNNYFVVNRMMIEAEVVYENGETVKADVLNDVVVKGNSRNISDFKVSIEGQTVSALRADGLIFSTPTGATGYSLSASGPIIEPEMECIEFTQICPHSLFARTMIFSPNKRLEVSFNSIDEEKVTVLFDGKNDILISKNDRLYITKSKSYIKTIEINKGNFYESINNKLLKPLKESI